jgi:Na+-driven multidrug efflux pump
LLSAVFRGMGDMRFPASLMVFGAMLQVPLAGTLILGWFGFLKMGISGAATAYFASPGARAVFWPVFATIVRFGIAGAGAMLGV